MSPNQMDNDKDMGKSKKTQNKFTVIDTKTGKKPNFKKINFKESWATGFVWQDIRGFAITESGELILTDYCGHIASCPEGRFKIKWVP